MSISYKKSERAVSRVLCPLFWRGGDHFSGARIASGLERSTRKSRTGRPYPRRSATNGAAGRFPMRSCSRRGFPSILLRSRIWWALTPPFHPCQASPAFYRLKLRVVPAVFFSVALSMGSPPVPFRDRLALRSSDFPLPLRRAITSPALIWNIIQCFSLQGQSKTGPAKAGII